MPGLLRSMMCGKRPIVPSANGTSDTGHQAPGAASVSSTWPPTDSPRRRPSPVAEGAATVRCPSSAGNMARRRSGSCGKPPAASTTPRRARTSTSPSGVPSTAPRHGAAFLEQPHRRGGCPQFDAEIGGRAQQPPHQGEAVAQLHAPPVQGEVDQVPAEATRQHGAKARGERVTFMNAARSGPAWMVMPMNVVSRIGRRRRCDEVPEPARVVGCGDDRASAGSGARGVAVGVGDLVAALELQRGVLLEEGDHARRRGEEGVDPGRVEIVAEHMAQVGARRLGVLDDPGALRQRVQRRPHPAAGPGRGAAEHRLLLRHDHLQPVPGGGHGGRQAARAEPITSRSHSI